MKKLISIIAIYVCVLGFAQAQRAISGKITDQSGQSLIGANVLVKGTSVGTVADIDGRYNINLPPGANTIVVSYTGFETKELVVGASNQLDVILTEGVVLEAAVVTALGIKRDEKSLGYAVSQVDGEELTKSRDPNIINQLAGRAAGVTVIGSNGNLGSSSRITIRGSRSVYGNNQPLFVVDGVPMDNSNFTSDIQVQGFNGGVEGGYDYGNAIQDLNPDDIESMSVLKGQAAAALYGSRGANGVIIVTTKKGGKSGRGIGVSFNHSLTFDRVLILPKYQKLYGGGVDLLPHGYSDNSGFYKTTLTTLNEDGSVDETFQSFDLVPIYAVDESNGVRFATSTDQHFQHLVDGGGYGFPNGFGSNQDFLNFRDWNSWDEWDTEHFGKSRRWEVGDDPRTAYFETGVSSSHNISFDGGGDRSAFRLSYNRFDQKGIYPNSHMERNTLSFNGSLDLNSHISTFLGINYVNSSAKGRSSTVYDNTGGINPAMNFNQWWHTHLRFEDLKSYENPDGTMRTWNRISADNGRPNYWDNPYWARYKNYQTDGRDRVYGNTGLTWKINSAFSLTGRLLSDFYTEEREERIAVGSITTSNYTQDLYRVNETNADLTLRFNKNLSESISFSAFAGGNKLWRTLHRNYGSTVGGLNVPDIYTLQNSVGRPNIRSTRTEKQINSLFAGASFGLNSLFYLDLTGRQDWSSSLPDDNNGYFYPSASASFVFSELLKGQALSFGKLRLGWAKVGNDTDPYNIYTTYQPNSNFGNLANFTVPNTLNNAKLKPESTTSIELGTDLRFFRNRFGLDLTVYTGKTTDQILPLATTSATGYTQQFINTGEISNKGIEVSLNIVPVQTSNFTWEAVFNFGKNKNEVVSLLPDDPSVRSLPIATGAFGPSLEAYIGEPFGTLVGSNYLFDEKGNRLVDPNSGFYLSSTDVMPIGNTTPDFTGGFTNNFMWKGISLNIFIDFRKGGDIWSVTNVWGRYSGLLEETGKYRETGVVNKGVPAVLDAEGNPVLTGGGDTETKLDDTYQSTGTANTLAADDAASRFLDGGYIIKAADIYDGSFIKLREISLGYTLPSRWFGRANVRDVRLSVVSRNVAILFKNLPHLDPDSAISTSNIQGLEGGAAPTTRSIGVNLNFKF